MTCSNSPTISSILNGNTDILEDNQVTDGTACRPVTVIYARGTSQAGNVGDSAAVGPLFFNNLASRLGGTSQLAIQGVTYSASVSGFLQGGDPTGSTTMTNLISTVSTIS